MEKDLTLRIGYTVLSSDNKLEDRGGIVITSKGSTRVYGAVTRPFHPSSKA
jgi:hypothetical protein